MSTVSPDRRKYCGSSDVPVISLFGCNQQYKSSDASVPILRNVTAVPNYTASGDTYITPYARPEVPTAPSCGAWDDYDCGDGVNGNLYCGIPSSTGAFAPDLGGSSSFAVGNFQNFYVTTDQTQSFAHCREAGFKNVYASKKWHGRKSFLSHDWNGYDNFNELCGCTWQSKNATPDTTKYLTMEVTLKKDSDFTKGYRVLNGGTKINCDCFGEVCPYDVVITDHIVNGSSFTRTFNIERYTGNLTVTCTSSSYADVCWNALDRTDNTTDCTTTSSAVVQCICNPALPECQTLLTSSMTGSGDYPDDALFSLANSNNNSIPFIYCDLKPAGDPDIVEGSMSEGSMTLTWTTTDNCCHPAGETPFVTITVTPNSIEYSEYGDLFNEINGEATGCEGLCTWGPLRITRYIYTETTFHYADIEKTQFATGGEGQFYTSLDVTLSNPYTATEVKSDAEGLLAFWDMGDDVLYPWRQDGNVNVGPYVHYDEGELVRTIDATSCTSATSSVGAVVGVPGPRGIDKIWSPTHRNYCVCTDINDFGEECRFIYLDSYGAWSVGGNTPEGIPPAATDWVTDRMGNAFPQGAFVIMNRFDSTPGTCVSEQRYNDDEVWVCKWAEITSPRNSINFARPCNEDRLQVDPTSRRCISGITASAGLIDIEPSGEVVTDGGYFWICGTGGVADGLYYVDVSDAYQYQLGQCYLSASAVAFNPIENCGEEGGGLGMISRLRWQNITEIPGICGRVNITAATNNSPVTCSLSEPCTLIDNDSVIVLNAVGNNINGTWTIKVIDSNTVALLGTDGTSASSYTGGGQMASYTGADWAWDDNTPKGDYTTLQWEYDFRELGEWNRLAAEIAAMNVSCSKPSNGAEPRYSQSVCGLDQNVTNVTCTTDCFSMNACAPSVAYFAPSGQDNFVGNSRNHGWYNGTLDYQYGSAWQGLVKQSIDDPFWKAPPCPCEFDELTSEYKCISSWTEDDGTCHEDDVSIEYYPMAPEVEARCEIPSGAPSLVSGVHLGCASVSELAAGDCTVGNVCYVPAGNINDWPDDDGCPAYNPHVYTQPWVNYNNKFNCVCADGRFATQYEDQGIACNLDFMPPP